MSFARYPAYKDSGVEWLGEVPEHWDVAPLKRLAKLTTGLTPPTDTQSYYSTCDDGHPWVRPEDLDETGAPTTASKFLSHSGMSVSRHVAAGATLICCIGTIGKVGIVNTGVATNQQITAAKFSGHDRFFFWTCYAARTQFELSSTGNVLRILNTERLGQTLIPAPPLEEQTAIATFLDRETAKIDALVAEQERLIALLNEKRQAVISHAVTKGLNPDAPMKDSGVEWLGEVPAHWDIAALNYRYEVLLGKMLDEKRITGQSLAPYLRNVDVQWDRINTGDLPEMDFDGVDVERYRLRIGDLLVCEGGEVGRAAIWSGAIGECYYQKALHRLRPRKLHRDSSRFQYYVLSMAATLGVFTGGAGKATIAHLTAESFRRYRFAYPPFLEQVDIVKRLDAETNKLDVLLDEAQSTITILNERRAALISAAVTGQIDVRELTPAEAA